MKRTALILTILSSTLLCSLAALAQDDLLNSHHRAALTSMMVYHPTDTFGYEAYKTFISWDDSEVYDRHDIGLHVIDDSEITGVKRTAGLYRKTYGGIGSDDNVVLTRSEREANARAILSLLNRAQVGNRIVARWYNLQGANLQTACFNMDEISRRTAYDITKLQADVARFTIDGEQNLMAQGTDLIEHSFVCVTDLTYVTSKRRGQTAATVLKVLTLADECSGKVIDRIVDSFDGFRIWAASYLYQLDWNDSIANEFYLRYYTETPNPDKVYAFMQDTSLFKVKLVAASWCRENFVTLDGKYNQTELFRMATNRCIDNNISQLQAVYKEFSPITIVRDVVKEGKKTYLKADLGTKEGVGEDTKEQYEILLATWDSKNMRMDYKEVGTAVPRKGYIMDNRYEAFKTQDDGATLTTTMFEITQGADHVQSGMLIRRKNTNNKDEFHSQKKGFRLYIPNK